MSIYTDSKADGIEYSNSAWIRSEGLDDYYGYDEPDYEEEEDE